MIELGVYNFEDADALEEQIAPYWESFVKKTGDKKADNIDNFHFYRVY